MQAIVDAPQETVPRKVRPPRAGRLGTAQVVAAEIGLLAVIGAGYALPPALALPVAVVVVAGTLVVVGRYRGRWWYELGAAVIQLRRRQALSRAAPQDSTATSEWRELCRVAPDVTISHVEHRNMHIGLGLDDQGWFAAIELAAPDGLTASGAAALPLGSLTRLAGPLSTVQLLTRVAPFSGADPRSPCAESYRELRAMLAVPAERQAWIVVRLAPGEAADAAADRGGDIGGVHATLSAALARIGEELTSRGIPHHVLDGPGLRQALVAGYGPGPYDGTSNRGRHSPRESWRRWRGSRAQHLCYAVISWPAKTAPVVLDALAQVPSAYAVNVGVVAGALRRPDHADGPLATRVVVRLVAASELEGECRRQLRERARQVGARLVRLDGEHALAVWSTMPTASPYGWGRPW
jgi:type VII secretion protein EccE